MLGFFIDMDNKILLFQELAKIFKEHGYSLYIVGGAVRDFLLGKNLQDVDLVSEATPDEILKFYTQIDATFAKYGSIILKYKEEKFDLTTLRKEADYCDSRHPQKIIFTKDISEDVLRRDFTVNALYLDANLKLYDLVDGEKDLVEKVLKMIGDPNKRIQEDPLRILRAIRFSIDYDFTIDEPLKKALISHYGLIKKLNPQKIEQEIGKCSNKQKMYEMLSELEKM